MHSCAEHSRKRFVELACLLDQQVSNAQIQINRNAHDSKPARWLQLSCTLGSEALKIVQVAAHRYIFACLQAKKHFNIMSPMVHARETAFASCIK
eukprot:6188150-Pleurochrysis_carterae.AAC.2